MGKSQSVFLHKLVPEFSNFFAVMPLEILVESAKVYYGFLDIKYMK
jgi:hypothetical protein